MKLSLKIEDFRGSSIEKAFQIDLEKAKGNRTNHPKKLSRGEYNSWSSEEKKRYTHQDLEASHTKLTQKLDDLHSQLSPYKNLTQQQREGLRVQIVQVEIEMRRLEDRMRNL